jgi:hypothetical protein
MLRKSFLKYDFVGKVEGKDISDGKMRRRRRQLLDDTKERGYWKVKEEALDRFLWRTRFGREYVPLWKTAHGINK